MKINLFRHSFALADNGMVVRPPTTIILIAIAVLIFYAYSG